MLIILVVFLPRPTIAERRMSVGPQLSLGAILPIDSYHASGVRQSALSYKVEVDKFGLLSAEAHIGAGRAEGQSWQLAGGAGIFMDLLFNSPVILGGHLGGRRPVGRYSTQLHVDYGGQLGARFDEKFEGVIRASVGQTTGAGFIEFSFRLAYVF